MVGEENPSNRRHTGPGKVPTLIILPFEKKIRRTEKPWKGGKSVYMKAAK